MIRDYQRRIPGVASMGIKGGTGKSMIAANLAAALELLDLTVGLVDLDVDSPNLTRMLGFIDKDGIVDMMDQTGPERLWIPKTWRDIQVVSTGLIFDRLIAFSKWGTDNWGIVRSLITKTAWHDKTDLLVFDLGAGSSDETKAILEADEVRDLLGVVLVALPNTQDALRRAVELCVAKGIYILGVVENMKGIVSGCCDEPAICKKCGKPVLLFDNPAGAPNIESVAKELDIKYYGSIPYTEGLDTMRDGGPVLSNSEVLKGIAEDIDKRLVEWLEKIAKELEGAKK